MYEKIISSASITEIIALRLMSFAIDAPTLSEDMIPLGFSSVEVNSSRVRSSRKNPRSASWSICSISASTAVDSSSCL